MASPPSSPPPSHSWTWDNQATRFKTSENVQVNYSIQDQKTIEFTITTISRNIFQKLFNFTFQRLFDNPVEILSQSKSQETYKIENDQPDMNSVHDKLEALRKSGIQTADTIKHYISEGLSQKAIPTANKTNETARSTLPLSAVSISSSGAVSNSSSNTANASNASSSAANPAASVTLMSAVQPQAGQPSAGEHPPSSPQPAIAAGPAAPMQAPQAAPPLPGPAPNLAPMQPKLDQEDVDLILVNFLGNGKAWIQKQQVSSQTKNAMDQKLTLIQQNLQQPGQTYTLEELLSSMKTQLQAIAPQDIEGPLAQWGVGENDLMNDLSPAGQFDVFQEYQNGELGITGQRINPINPMGAGWEIPTDHIDTKVQVEFKNLKFSIVGSNGLHRNYYKFLDPNNKYGKESKQGLKGSAVTTGMNKDYQNGLDARERAYIDQKIDELTHPTHPANVLCLQEISPAVQKALIERLQKIEGRDSNGNPTGKPRFQCIVPSSPPFELLDIENPVTKKREPSQIDLNDCGMMIYDADKFEPPENLLFMNYHEITYHKSQPQTASIKYTKYAFGMTLTAKDSKEKVRIINTHAQSGRISELDAKFKELMGNEFLPTFVVGDFNESSKAVAGRLSGLSARPGGTHPTAGGLWQDYDGIVACSLPNDCTVTPVYDPKHIFHKLKHQNHLKRSLYHVTQSLKSNKPKAAPAHQFHPLPLPPQASPLNQPQQHYQPQWSQPNNPQQAAYQAQPNNQQPTSMLTNAALKGGKIDGIMLANYVSNHHLSIELSSQERMILLQTNKEIYQEIQQRKYNNIEQFKTEYKQILARKLEAATSLDRAISQRLYHII